MERTTSINKEYLSFVIAQFKQYRSLAEDAIKQLSEDEIYLIQHEGSNSIAIIMNHMAGNMRSRWTDFLVSDGEKSWRHRDLEFEDPPMPLSELERNWSKGWEVLLDTLGALTPDQLSKEVTIRGEKHSVLQAIQRQLAHYSYHVGQIVLLARQFRGKTWTSLSIPKGQSEQFNRKMKDRYK